MPGLHQLKNALVNLWFICIFSESSLEYMRIQYTKTKFLRPKTISKPDYLSIKNLLTTNPNASIDSNPEKFTDEFGGRLKVIAICAVLTVIGLLLDSMEPNALLYICFMGMLVGSIFLVMLFLEAPSFATYLKNKINYFDLLRKAVIKSNSYEEFLDIFEPTR